MDIEPVGARFGKYLKIALWLLNHQMNVEKLLRHTAHGFNHHRPKGDVRHKIAVHDVQMEQVGASGFGFADLFAQLCEVSSKDRRRNLKGKGHGLLSCCG